MLVGPTDVIWQALTLDFYYLLYYHGFQAWELFSWHCQ